MVGYEYKVIPAPAKGLKARGVKGPEARFSNALENRINEIAAEGWEYLRSEILPSEERQGLTSTQTVYRSVLVFRREIEPEDSTDDVIEDIAEDGAEDEDVQTETSDDTEDEVDESSDADDSVEDKT